MMMMMQQPVRVKTINTFECGYAMWYIIMPELPVYFNASYPITTPTLLV